MSAGLRKELIIAGVLILFGIAVLPFLVYLVGGAVVGPYEGGEGVGTLYQAILRGLVGLNPATWLLVLSPLTCIELLRYAARRSRKSVKPVAE